MGVEGGLHPTRLSRKWLLRPGNAVPVESAIEAFGPEPKLDANCRSAGILAEQLCLSCLTN
jgi:hypothetical protein